MEINVNGIELHYDIVGNGKSVILLNPNSVHTKLFMKPIVKLFSKDFKVYCVDRRGCEKIMIAVFGYNENAIKFYEKNGYHMRMMDMIED